jgi:hypothetical protein
MFAIEMTHVGRIDVVGSIYVFGKSARIVERGQHDLASLNYAGPPTASWGDGW